MSSTQKAYADAEQVKKDIRDRLESSGQYGKMKAMIVSAALQSMKESDVPTATQGTDFFVLSETMKRVADSENGQLALSMVMDFLQHLGLMYTASVLKLESGVEQFESAKSMANALHTSSSSTSCALLQLVEAAVSGGKILSEAKKGSPAEEEENEDDEKDDAASTDSSGSEERSNSSSSAASTPASTSSSSSSRGDKASHHSTDEEDHRDGENKEKVGTKEDEDEDEEDEPGVPTGKNSEDSTYFVSKWKGRTVTRINEVSGQQVQLEYLENCRVRILDPLDSATVDDCEGGEIIFAACEGSVFLRNCKKMIVHVACKQLRLRDCEDLDVCLFTTTDPVVEMSHHISFKPFHLRLPNLPAHFNSARLDPKTNRFVHVYDFTEDEPGLPKPHYTVHFPDHGLKIESRCGDRGEPICPVEIEDLLAGRLLPAASSETGENKSYNIKTGAAAWTGVAASTAKLANPLPSAVTEDNKKPPLATPAVPVVAAAAAAATVSSRATPGGLDDQEYSDFEDDSDENSDDEVSVDEDDDEF